MLPLLPAFLLPGAIPPARAHSTEEALQELREGEPYLQLVDYPAPAFALEDADGRKVRLGDLAGNVVVFNFLYSRCTDACPLHMRLIADLQGQINATLMRDQVRFVTIATDTEEPRETASIMRQYGARHGMDPRNWTFLHGGPGNPDGGMAAAKTYGLEFTPTADGQQMHGVVTHVIDANGGLRARFHGLKLRPLALTNFIGALLYPDHPAGGRSSDETDGVFGILNHWRERVGAAPAWGWGLAIAPMLGVLGFVVARRLRAARGNRRDPDPPGGNIPSDNAVQPQSEGAAPADHTRV
ncbi:MAG: SCO family protein [Betaproteobacteria bacterium]|nr:SCO family protein [Betaproteobacteria bacterium]